MKCPVDCKDCPLENKEYAVEKNNIRNQTNGCIIHVTVDDHLFAAQKAMEEALKAMTIGQMINKMIAVPTPKD